MHGLNVFDDNTEIILPKGINNIYDVKNNVKVESNIDDYLKLSNYEDESTFKYYILDEIEEGKCSLLYRDTGFIYTISYDSKVNPYLGIWITKGGLKGEYNCALEPCNDFYDSLDRAIDKNKFSEISPKEIKEWTVNIRISEVK